MSEYREAARKKRDELIADFDDPLAIPPKVYSLLELLHVDAIGDAEPLDEFIKRRCAQKKYQYGYGYGGY